MRNGQSTRHIVIAILVQSVLLSAIPPAATAQGVVRLERGTRVRVNLEQANRSVVATLLEVKRDTLVLGRTYGTVESTMPFAVEQIRKLEVWNGKRASLAPFGALAGVILGAAVAASYNAIVSSQCFPPQPCSDGFSVWMGAGIGGVLGGVSLAFVRPDRWLEITLPR